MLIAMIFLNFHLYTMRLCASSVSVAHSSCHYFVLHVRLGNRDLRYCQAKHLLNSCYTSQFSSLITRVIKTAELCFFYITIMIITVIKKNHYETS